MIKLFINIHESQRTLYASPLCQYSDDDFFRLAHDVLFPQVQMVVMNS